jgi:hypothetical protein
MTGWNRRHSIDIDLEGHESMKHPQRHITASHGRRRRLLVPPALVAGVLSAVAIAGCGGSSKAPVASSSAAAAQVQASTSTASSQTSTAVQPSATAKSTKSSHKSRAKVAHHSRGAKHATHSSRSHSQVISSTPSTKVTKGNPVHKPAPGTGGNSVNDDTPNGKASFADSGGGANGPTNPCSLVSQAQASAFTGKSIGKPHVAPLGPTCVYSETGGRTEVTMALELAAFAKVKPHIHALSQVSVAGHVGYCGVYGTPIVYVPMAQDRLLSISAPCSVGTKFAAAAMPKLGAYAS